MILLYIPLIWSICKVPLVKWLIVSLRSLITNIILTSVSFSFFIIRITIGVIYKLYIYSLYSNHTRVRTYMYIFHHRKIFQPSRRYINHLYSRAYMYNCKLISHHPLGFKLHCCN